MPARLAGRAAWALGLAACLGSGSARAFCRTTTCDTDSPPPECRTNTKDNDGCSTLGTPLFWPNRCSWFGVQENGSERRGITYPVFHDAVARAFDKWANVDCGGGQPPSFDMTDADSLYGPEVCDASEYNPDSANASAWMFRDTSWPHAGGGDSDIAVTLVRAEVTSGQIVDADVELNSFAVAITASGDGTGPDLDAIVLHEAGHFLGLAHSLDVNATMNAYYSSRTAKGGNLGEDDVAGICAAYPPSASPPICGEPEPLFGFSRFCGGASPSTTPETTASASSVRSGCAVGPPRRSLSTWPALFSFVTFCAYRRRRHWRRDMGRDPKVALAGGGA